MQTALLLCVADGHPGMFKTLAACKLEDASGEFGEDSIQLWAAITVRVPPNSKSLSNSSRLAMSA